MNQYFNLAQSAETCTSNYEFKSAIEYFEQALQQFPEHTIFTAYNLGCLYQTQLGLGEKAKVAYLKAVDWHNVNPSARKENPKARQELENVLAATFENLSQLSDSYEEMYEWAEKVWEINPNEQILRENVESTKTAQQKGVKWGQAYFEMAQLFWDTDLNKDRGLHGFGASIYRRLLLNRKQYRLDRQLYSYCANGYSGLMMMILSKIGQNMEQKTGSVKIEEIDFVFDETIKLLKEYLIFNPNDERVSSSVIQIEELKVKIRLREGRTQKIVGSASTPENPNKAPALSFIGSLVGLIAVWFLINKFQIIQGWGYYVLGFFVGSFLGSFIHYISKRKTQSVQNTHTTNSDTGKTQVDINESDLSWQKGADLIRTIKTLGFSNVSCKLEVVRINQFEGCLEMVFISETNYPQHLMHQVGLALRCSVARTLGIAAAATDEIFLVEPVEKYNIKLGDGLMAEAFTLMHNNIGIGPLQTTSREVGNNWIIQVKPFYIVGVPHEEAQKQRMVFSQLIPTFEKMKDLRIRFSDEY